MDQESLDKLRLLLDREPHVLAWTESDNSSEARLGEPGDGVVFMVTHYPTCYRRGPWRLQIEIYGGPGHHKWGCFDEQDQPLRNFHNKDCLLQEADSIARVLIHDRYQA